MPDNNHSNHVGQNLSELDQQILFARPAPQRHGAADKAVVDLSVLVVSYNTVDLLRKCLQSVYANLSPRWELEVLVVDNASRDGSAEMVRQEFPQAQLIANSDNKGFAAANNQAIALSKGQYIVLLNSDAEVVGDALWKMMAYLEAEPGAAVVGPKLIYPDGSFQEGVFRFPSLTQIFLDFFPLNWRLTRSRFNGRYPRRYYEGEFPRAFEIDFPLGACLMVKRTVIEQVGLLDESYFMYMEEIDWCYRIKAAGMPPGYESPGLRFRPGRRKVHHWRNYCLPSATVIHHGGASAKQFRGEMFYQLHKSRRLFYRKHYSPRFQKAAATLTRFGLGWQSFSSRLARLTGRITKAELADRLAVYRRMKDEG